MTSRGTAKAARCQPTANPAMVYDYLLGGKTNFRPDRLAAQRLIREKPTLPASVRASRAFLRRTVQSLAQNEGTTQFLDIGIGMPAANSTLEVAQRANPAARAVYVDNDPLVLLWAEALLGSGPEGACIFVNADLRDPARILFEARRALDFTEPVAVLLLGILNYLTDAEDPYGIVRQLMAASASGSYLAIVHPASDLDTDAAAKVADQYGRLTGTVQTNRTHAQVTRFFDGLELLEPGVVEPSRWHPGPGDRPEIEMANWAGVARKP
jgi:hypothetical protein